MTEPIGYRPSRSAELARWCCAGLAALAVHAGAAAFMMRDAPPEVPADDQPPAAVMIELATVAEAVETELTEISPDEMNAEAAQPVEEAFDEIAEEEPVEEVVEAEPDQASNEIVEEIEEPVEQKLAVVPNAAVTLPVAKPKPPEKKKPEAPKPAVKKKQVEEKKVRPRLKPQASSKEAVTASAQVQKSNRNAARQTASGLFSSVSPARWQSRLKAHLERRKRYPAAARKRGERGIAHIRFRIDDSGNVLSASLVRSSGFSELDGEALSLVRRASPVPAPPPDANKTITAPIEFGR